MAETLQLKVLAGNHDRVACPVQVELPWQDRALSVTLRDLDTKRVLPCQVEQTKSGLLLWWLVANLKAGQVQRLRVERSTETPASVVRLSDDEAGSKVDVSIRGELFTSYHYGSNWARPFLHPIIGPHGTRVTRSWPVENVTRKEEQDHPHHKSIWVAYGECDNVDNWSEEPGHGWQLHKNFVAKTSGPVFGRLTARNDWANAKRKKQFEETRELRFYALPNGERLFDLAVSFRMTEKSVTFRDTKEGGLVSVRVATSMDVRNGGTIENGYGGVNEDETWGKKAPWCDYSGEVDGHRVGIAVLDHPDNPRYPTEWHVRDYGLMTANCFAWKYYRPEKKQRGDMTFKKGSVTKWRYRVLIHKGDATRGKVKNRFMDFIAPPVVAVE